jgi:acetylornithine deacetylase/succinyl-diaminopimelate desuccinylase-like protein
MLAALFCALLAAPPMPDDLVPAALALLEKLIAADTSNPPGNEKPAAEIARAALEEAGIPVEWFEPKPGRVSLVARLRGTGARKPLLLVAHLDTVPALRDEWASDPWKLTPLAGSLRGRGVIDDKGMAAAFTAIMAELSRLRPAFARDLVLLLSADEEEGGAHGREALVAAHPEWLDAEIALNEGGNVRLSEDGRRVVSIEVQNEEKVPRNFILRASGIGGHSSMPRGRNAIAALARAVDRAAAVKHPKGTTCTPTLFNAGLKSNIIPERAEATLNCRLMPGEMPAAVEARLRKAIRDPEIEIEIKPPGKPDWPSSPPRGPLYDAIKRASAQVFPGVKVVPYMSPGATDSAELRRRGIHAYGLLPFPLTEEDDARMHGANERMPEASFAPGVKLLWHIIWEVSKG